MTPTRRGINPVSVDIEKQWAGIQQQPIVSGQDAATATYFTIDGRSLGQKAPTTPGIYIRREATANGQMRAMKIVKTAE